MPHLSFVVAKSGLAVVGEEQQGCSDSKKTKEKRGRKRTPFLCACMCCFWEEERREGKEKQRRKLLDGSLMKKKRIKRIGVFKGNYEIIPPIYLFIYFSLLKSLPQNNP